nr:hypothetical protein [uncultured Campylobacter sp.]
MKYQDIVIVKLACQNFYLIGGQPGAGKSTTIKDCIAINLDDCCSTPSSIQNFSNR